jgi:hypothetical protein
VCTSLAAASAILAGSIDLSDSMSWTLFRVLLVMLVFALPLGIFWTVMTLFEQKKSRGALRDDATPSPRTVPRLATARGGFEIMSWSDHRESSRQGFRRIVAGERFCRVWRRFIYRVS